MNNQKTPTNDVIFFIILRKYLNMSLGTLISSILFPLLLLLVPY